MAEFPVVIVVADDKKGLPPFFLSLHRDGLDQIVKAHDVQDAFQVVGQHG